MTTLTHTPKYDIAYKSGSYGPYLSEIPTLYLPNDAKLEDLNLTIIEWCQLINAIAPGDQGRPLLTRSFNREDNNIDIHFESTGLSDDMYLNISVMVMEKFKSLGYTSLVGYSLNADSKLTENAKSKYSYKSVKKILDRLNGVNETMINTLIDAIQIEFDDAIESLIDEVFGDKDLGEYMKADQLAAAKKRQKENIEAANELKKQKTVKEEIRLKLVAAEAEVRKFTAQMEGFL